ncbi:MAG TPA: PAS domain S-box protein [Ktedonobacteraceae bacterium]
MINPSINTGYSPWREMYMQEHSVQFSEADTSLINAVLAFIENGKSTEDTCVVIATQSHREMLEQRLTKGGLDITQQNRYLSFDAATLLAQFMIDGQPSAEKFMSMLGSIITRATAGQGKVRIFEEMIALLLAEGKRTAAFMLENLWDRLSGTQVCALFCAHTLRLPNEREVESANLSSRNYTRLSEEEQLQTLALLQQKADSLEVEIVERQKVEQRLRALAAIVESSDDAILSKDLEGTITSWNTGAERIYGHTADEIVGQSIALIFPEDKQDEFRQILERIRQGEWLRHYETKGVHKNGTVLTVSITVSPIKNEFSAITGASTIARDITEQRKLEARSDQLFTSNLIGIFVVDPNGNIIEANDAFLKLVEYTRAEWEAGAIPNELFTDSPAEFLELIAAQQVQKMNVSAPRETVVWRKGRKALPVIMAMTCLEQSQNCIGFVLDISESKELDQRRDDFISMASHELKTPVTSLKGFLGLLQRQGGNLTNERALHYLERMDAQIDKLTILINDLLDISKIRAGHLTYREERFEIDALVKEIVENVQETTQTHQLRLEGQAQAQIWGDRDRLGQVLNNLLTNAIKYSPQADTVMIHIETQGEQVVINVRDFGFGISKEHQGKIFERFYQVPEEAQKTYPGLGIGLYISEEIVKRHRGRLWVESQKGQGANFYLSLPLLMEENGLDARVAR